ncbi:MULTISPECIES: hypothetical protein [Streptomyces]|uniref:Uncharacterized protein n=1 Tax=Streptomyces chartreusis NRRL 3882 TaxID=1079985 RepID=A0A2N9B9Q1_STRCX|nr:MULTISPECIES: hypothetical protein [Streptomyces]MYS93852.1 hypothetical protein [Streptomyces sp. SID5464]SOR80083.1 hypothetical protein SCNRRL3882_3539 [Streptomyces chartreusis NRRL 3882]
MHLSRGRTGRTPGGPSGPGGRPPVRRWSDPGTGPEDDDSVIRTAHFSPPPHAAAVFRMEAGRSCPRPRTPRPSSCFSGLATPSVPVPAAEWMLRLHDTSAGPAYFGARSRERAAAEGRQTGKSFR